MKHTTALLCAMILIAMMSIVSLMILNLTPAGSEPLPQQTYLNIKPISYRVIPCNVAGHENEYDYVIEVSTRDLETANEIINILNGGLYYGRD